MTVTGWMRGEGWAVVCGRFLSELITWGGGTTFAAQPHFPSLTTRSRGATTTSYRTKKLISHRNRVFLDFGLAIKFLCEFLQFRSTYMIL